MHAHVDMGVHPIQCTASTNNILKSCWRDMDMVMDVCVLGLCLGPLFPATLRTRALVRGRVDGVRVFGEVLPYVLCLRPAVMRASGDLADLDSSCSIWSDFARLSGIPASSPGAHPHATC